MLTFDERHYSLRSLIDHLYPYQFGEQDLDDKFLHSCYLINYLNDITTRLREFRYSVLLTDEQPFHLVYSLQLMNHLQTRYLAEYLQAEW